ncbi:TetR/AcrR family transcriptional regulator [Rhodococcus sp. BP-252]|uniref:TetR/AcrR family transcriptional regulator n=1 Tax=unclassified Rhodococcus (in: high G+C Gram-positive bacteria) TaxID=192944 RepID=UPI000DF24300|nr:MULTISPECIES: TetR/AcrR family transcriptional regulator [unclassified Rhodococcus (in: high G+C Gram-positive bacteria)]MBY6411953.1 TetR/AcrR family transcriptional regulator [Rhodococcus sp. BP-320]MBY6416419.1 TetR/AcrR family transcriptional regulator [Rhodococcus sp. BP-321]MBY6420775.1 TetR/AcrR family transcriptional regulator [Rhodococcus sp. BP-324]MBY6426443.1 TetR/AcrR family transcriptional regulator [Rhodococcus sp. BP-323]MBY6431442.1 TetR/AcrR family transcriptional regulato
MPTTPRERARAQTLADITRIGRQHLAADGAAALSLRAVARDLGVVSSAVYRYVKSRDELLTLLVVDAYNELGDEVDAAVDAVDDSMEKFLTLGRAVRAWARREPASYALLFGSPVPGYHAPAEQTTGPGIRVIVKLVQVFDQADRDGRLSTPPSPVPLESLHDDFATVRNEMGTEMSDAALAGGVLVWASLFGAVSFDVFDQYGSANFVDRELLFEHQLALLAGLVGLS